MRQPETRGCAPGGRWLPCGVAQDAVTAGTGRTCFVACQHCPATYAALQAVREDCLRGEGSDQRTSPVNRAGLQADADTIKDQPCHSAELEGYQTAASRALLQLAPSSQQAIAWKILCSVPVSTAYKFSPVLPVKLQPASCSKQHLTWHRICSTHLPCAQTQTCLKQSAAEQRVPSPPCRHHHLLKMGPSRVEDICCQGRCQAHKARP